MLVTAWLQPSIIATLLATLLMFLCYAYLYSQEKIEYLRYFSIAWAFYSLRFIIMLISLKHNLHLFTEVGIFFSALLNCGFLFIGVQAMLTKIRNNLIPYILIIPVLLFILLELFIKSPFIRTTVVFIISGGVYIYIGYIMIRENRNFNISKIIGVVFILWGLHKFDYPFLVDSAVFAPFGLLLSSLFSLIIALGIVLLFYQINKTELVKDEERLSSLLDIIETPDIQFLLDNVLALAIKITDSEYGFISRYFKDTEEMTLTTWSDEVYAGCRVMEKEKKPKLETAGCWAEAARQRKPVIINSFSAEDRRIKGTPEGHLRINSFCSIPVFSEGEFAAVIGVANKKGNYNKSDVRQLTLLMDNAWKIILLKNYQSELEEAKMKAEESSELKTAFLANVSHELRTPLNGILGMLSLIEKNKLPEDTKNFLSMARISARDMSNLVEEILCFSQVTNSRFRVEISEFDLVEDINMLVKFLRVDAEKKGLSIRFESELEVCVINSDQTKLHQILINIISNALKFSNEGIIELGLQRVERLQVTVKDQGIGIPEDKLDLIFEPFHQLENPYTKEHKGIGAGLAIVKGLCELLNIEIRVDSEPGIGTTFTLTFDDSVLSGDPRPSASIRSLTNRS